MAGRLESDPELDRERLFTEVLDAFKIDGRLPVLPYAFTMQGVYLRRDVLEELQVDPASITTVDAEDVLGWYEQARAARPDMKLLFASTAKDVFIPGEMPAYIDLDAGASSLHSPAFVSLLQRTQDVLSAEPGLAADEVYGGSPQLFEAALRWAETGEIPGTVTQMEGFAPAPMHIVTKAQPAFCAVTEGSIYDLLTVLQPDTFSCLAGAYPLSSTDGRLGLQVKSATDFAMSSSLREADLAWAFIRYCLSGRKSPSFAQGGGVRYYCGDTLPVNKDNFVLLAQAAGESAKSQNGPCMEFFDFQPVDGDGLLALMDGILAQSPVSLGRYNLDLQDYLDEFYVNGLTTAE